MIPLRDTVSSKTYPIVNVGLIAVNVLVFLYEVSLGDRLNAFIMNYGLVPVRYFHLADIDSTLIGRFLPFFTSMFLHGGWLHIIGNMWYLWIFGDNVEDQMGHIKYFIFYILCGLSAAIAHLLINANSGMPTVGASGAIAGVMGAYLVLYPKAKVWTLIPIFFFIQFFELPAFIFIGIWILMQFVIGTFSLRSSSITGGIAWWAHVGGFVSGAILVFVFKKRKRKLPKRYADEYWPW